MKKYPRLTTGSTFTVNVLPGWCFSLAVQQNTATKITFNKLKITVLDMKRHSYVD